MDNFFSLIVLFNEDLRYFFSVTEQLLSSVLLGHSTFGYLNHLPFCNVVKVHNPDLISHSQLIYETCFNIRSNEPETEGIPVIRLKHSH